MDRQAAMHRISRAIFGGPIGRLTARAMEKGNAATEREAVTTLAPNESDAVLVIGFGPGLGIHHLAPRLPAGWIGGIDPSAVMHKRATTLNAAAIDNGRVTLKRATTTAIPWPDDTFTAAISVNTLQLWYPLPDSAREVARVLRPGSRLVTLTHDWALARSGGGSADAWLDSARDELRNNGFGDIEHWRGESENHGVIALCATVA
ncbi:MAG TPA: methyltransferase domain-containing protein [Stackebrandtia sp.]|jgi:SAM-dependent methyltransferase|uniref:class I SAM-dependent methyltransferase n=1 Tax=Stackebrandtia sp. TaxID=2023065 RepID=UPI002D3A0453|nr:methyltransferase domain-containing protein [Stackebrandtia sp.]HZE37220.1 methyltransferase domain-containing protein [Stackebrandtia sp.]